MPAHSKADDPSLSNQSISTPMVQKDRSGSAPPTAKQDLTERDYSFIRRLVYDRTRINLGSEKRHLVTARLNRRVRETGCDSFRDYC
ncbi:MAG TPA: hypothetical protein DIV79_08165 [Opitutae bacterium]|nr:hypothetical protein [Opitutaceae bacterium]HCR29974.1 hypothetical protein [Opitutae bacterium]